MRGRKSSKRIDTAGLEALVRDGRAWVKLGKVFAPDGGKHWQVKGGKILIEVETMPDGVDLTCRLTTWGSGGGFGGWAIPRVGTIVAVVVPDGEIEFHPLIVGVLDCNAAQQGVGEDFTIIADDRPVATRAPKVLLGDTNVFEAFIKGTSRRAHEATLNAAIAAYITAIAPIADPAGVATANLIAALQLYETQAQGDLSTVVFGK
jgi:hypothetical protein